MEIKILVLITILRSFSWENHKDPGEYVFQTRDEMIRVWQADGNKDVGLLPNNFEKETVVAVFAGQKQGYGHRVKIETIARNQEGGVVFVLYRQIPPPADARPNAQPVYPAHVVAIEKTEGDYRFFDVESAEGKQVLELLARSQAELKKQAEQQREGAK